MFDVRGILNDFDISEIYFVKECSGSSFNGFSFNVSALITSFGVLYVVNMK